MRRWAWRIFVAASAVLLVGTVGMWVRGQWVTDVFERTWSDRPQSRVRASRLAIRCLGGVLRVDVTTRSASAADYDAPGARPGLGWTDAAWSHQRFGPTPWLWRGPDAQFLGFGWQTREQLIPPVDPQRSALRANATFPSRLTGTAADVPWWFLALLFSLAPARALWTSRKRRRRPPHQCRACGYDLRATADAAGPRLATCPECGRASAG